MPYRDPQQKSAWDREHRPDHLAKLKDAGRWVDTQLATLKALGVTHTRDEWETVRRELKRQFMDGGAAPTTDPHRT
jgi:hypothetical protein